MSKWITIEIELVTKNTITFKTDEPFDVKNLVGMKSFTLDGLFVNLENVTFVRTFEDSELDFEPQCGAKMERSDEE